MRVWLLSNEVDNPVTQALCLKFSKPCFPLSYFTGYITLMIRITETESRKTFHPLTLLQTSICTGPNCLKQTT